MKHFKRWNEWRKHNGNSNFVKLLNLFKIIVSPTFVGYRTDEEIKNM